MAFRRKIFFRFLPAVRTFHSSINSESGAAHTQILGIHVLHCPDVVGIVSKVSECIAFRGANIHSVEVFVPENKQDFYSRRFIWRRSTENDHAGGSSLEGSNPIRLNRD